MVESPAKLVSKMERKKSLGKFVYSMKNQNRNIIAPKTDFLKDSKRADRHIEIVMAPEFRHAVTVAFAEYANRLAQFEGERPTAAPKLEGARSVLNILMELGSPTVPENIVQMEQLKPV